MILFSFFSGSLCEGILYLSCVMLLWMLAWKIMISPNNIGTAVLALLNENCSYREDEDEVGTFYSQKAVLFSALIFCTRQKKEKKLCICMHAC